MLRSSLIERHSIYFRLIVLTVISIGLSGCSFFSTKPDDKDFVYQDTSPIWQEYRSNVAPYLDWELQGKLGIRSPDDTLSAYLVWFQHVKSFDINLSGPLGVGATRIKGNDQAVVVDIANEGKFYADTPEELVQRLLGWTIPVSELVYWVRAIPEPNSTFTTQFNEQGQLIKLEQSGWTINYLRYLDRQTMLLPDKITLSREELTLTLIIKDWTLQAIF